MPHKWWVGIEVVNVAESSEKGKNCVHKLLSGHKDVI